MAKVKLHRAVFLDRDGTINEEVEYISRPDQIRVIPSSAEAIRELNGNGLKVVVVTNQAGVAYGYYSEEDLKVLHEELIGQLSRYGARLDAIYYCPHHPEGKVERYRMICDCRKPGIGMLLKAARDLKIDLSASYMIGDKLSDIGAGKKAGCFTILVETGFGRGEIAKGIPPELTPDAIVPELKWALPYIF